MSAPRIQTLVDHLREGAEQRPRELAFEYLREGGVRDTIDRGTLWRRVTLSAAEIRRYASRGDRVLVSHNPGIDFIVGLLGCFHAGVIAVPVPPPAPNQKLARIESIVADADPTAAVGAPGTAESLGESIPVSERMRRLRWLTAAGVEPIAAWDHDSVDSAAVALIQYTSGSTAQPKGVMISHANLMANIAAIGSRFEPAPGDHATFWLPPYHDMGLIGGILAAIVHRVSVTLMSPASFLRRPTQWIETMSATGSKVSGAPNFAYALCARRLEAKNLDHLDLSEWRVAFCGAEPVRASVMRHFSEVFSRCGFRADAVYPCYGLAEATLLVTGGAMGAGWKSRFVDSAVLEREKRAAAPCNEVRRTEIVSCGRACPEHSVRIVDSETHRPLPDTQVGEIWVSGPSVAQGYWGQPELSLEVFQAHAAGEDARSVYLRTGDLGFIDDGELFVTGRIKELIVIAGRNIYPEDIESLARASHASLSDGRSAAFEVEQGLVIVQEMRHRSTGPELEEVRRAVTRTLFDTCGLSLHDLIFVRSNSIPATTSGKTRRVECRDWYREGKLLDVEERVVAHE